MVYYCIAAGIIASLFLSLWKQSCPFTILSNRLLAPNGLYGLLLARVINSLISCSVSYSAKDILRGHKYIFLNTNSFKLLNLV